MLKNKLQQSTQITFKTNSALKEKALEKVKQEGITLKALLTMAMKAYLCNRLIVGVYPNNNDDYEILTDKKIVAKANKLGELLQSKEL